PARVTAAKSLENKHQEASATSAVSAAPAADPAQEKLRDSEHAEKKIAIEAQISGRGNIATPHTAASSETHSWRDTAIHVTSSASEPAEESSPRAANVVPGADPGDRKAPMAFHSARLTEQMGGPELRFTWRSPEMGEIQLSTSLRHRDVQMMVATDRGETASAMRAELPSLDQGLQGHSLRLGDVSIVAQERSMSAGLGMGNHSRGQHTWNPPTPHL